MNEAIAFAEWLLNNATLDESYRNPDNISEWWIRSIIYTTEEAYNLFKKKQNENLYV